MYVLEKSTNPKICVFAFILATIDFFEEKSENRLKKSSQFWEAAALTQFHIVSFVSRVWQNTFKNFYSILFDEINYI